jgi:hypothetical protein
MYSFKQPEILYEETQDGVSNGIPFMQIDKDSGVPSALFIGTTHDSEEKNEEGETIVDLVMHMYINASSISSILSPEEYEKLRIGLGFKPIKDQEN